MWRYAQSLTLSRDNLSADLMRVPPGGLLRLFRGGRCFLGLQGSQLLLGLRGQVAASCVS